MAASSVGCALSQQGGLIGFCQQQALQNQELFGQQRLMNLPALALASPKIRFITDIQTMQRDVDEWLEDWDT